MLKRSQIRAFLLIFHSRKKKLAKLVLDTITHKQTKKELAFLFTMRIRVSHSRARSQLARKKCEKTRIRDRPREFPFVIVFENFCLFG